MSTKCKNIIEREIEVSILRAIHDAVLNEIHGLRKTQSILDVGITLFT